MHNFKKVCLSLMALGLSVILLFLVVTAPYFHSTAYYYQDAGVRRELAGSLDTLICGSSHGFRAFVPAELDEKLGWNSYNLCCPMMTMQGRYTLLEKELARNPVDTVVLEVSYNALVRNRSYEGPEGDLYELGRFDNARERISYLIKTTRRGEYSEIFSDTVRRGLTSWKLLLQGKIAPPLQAQTKGFLGLPAQDLSVSPEELQELYLRQPLDQEISPESQTVFADCVAMCLAKGKRVIFVVTPLSTRHLAQYDGYDPLLQRFALYAASKGCEYYDLNLLKDRAALFPDDTAFADLAHLSEEGARTFSAELADLILRAQTGEDLSGEFYASYTEMQQALLSDNQ